MKDIKTLLSDIEVEIPEGKKADFEKAFAENYKTIAEVEKLRTARDNYKGQLDTANNSLKEFEGVDLSELNGKIKSLMKDLADKETEYQKKIADMEFSAVLESALTSSGARSAKAVKGMLDLDALKVSKNQAADIKQAIETVKSENDYLFESDEPFRNAVRETGGSNILGGAGNDLLRLSMGLPPLKKD